MVENVLFGNSLGHLASSEEKTKEEGGHMYEFAQARYEALKERVEVRKGSEEELRLICAEQRGTIEGYKREVRRLKAKRNGAVGQHEARPSSPRRGRLMSPT